MLRSRLFPAALAVLATVLIAGCSTTSPGLYGYDRTATSSINQRSASARNTGMETNDRTGYYMRKRISTQTGGGSGY